MSFTTEQAGKALCLTPNNMRKYRHNHKMGAPMGAGNLVIWTIDELRKIQELQGARWKLPKWSIAFSVPQLDDDSVSGSMRIWAIDKTTARSKATAWFWNALLKEEPAKWGVPVGFNVSSAHELALPPIISTPEEEAVLTFVTD